jgi:hypothetical protein
MRVPVSLLFASCIGLTIIEIPSAELDARDLLVAFAGFAAFVIAGWLVLEITLTLENLGGP